MSETILLRVIMTALSHEQGKFWRNNVGARGRVHYGLAKGAADIVGLVYPTGRFVALEVKSEHGAVRDEQLDWAAHVERSGGYYAVVRSVAEARAAVAAARRRDDDVS